MQARPWWLPLVRGGSVWWALPGRAEDMVSFKWTMRTRVKNMGRNSCPSPLILGKERKSHEAEREESGAHIHSPANQAGTHTPVSYSLSGERETLSYAPTQVLRELLVLHHWIPTLIGRDSALLYTCMEGGIHKQTVTPTSKLSPIIPTHLWLPFSLSPTFFPPACLGKGGGLYKLGSVVTRSSSSRWLTDPETTANARAS